MSDASVAPVAPVVPVIPVLHSINPTDIGPRQMDSYIYGILKDNYKKIICFINDATNTYIEIWNRLYEMDPVFVEQFPKCDNFVSDDIEKICQIAYNPSLIYIDIKEFLSRMNYLPVQETYINFDKIIEFFKSCYDDIGKPSQKYVKLLIASHTINPDHKTIFNPIHTPATKSSYIDQIVCCERRRYNNFKHLYYKKEYMRIIPILKKKITEAVNYSNTIAKMVYDINKKLIDVYAEQEQYDILGNITIQENNTESILLNAHDIMTGKNLINYDIHITKPIKQHGVSVEQLMNFYKQSENIHEHDKDIKCKNIEPIIYPEDDGNFIQ